MVARRRSLRRSCETFQVPRLFVALEPPDALRVELSRLGRALAGARPTPPEQLHLTLRFVGEVDAPTPEQLPEALSTLRAPAFELTPRGVGCFPNARRATVAWAGLAESPQLMRLQAAVEARVASCGLEAESKPFRPHFTVARLRRPDPHGLRVWLDAHAGFSGPAFPVTRVQLWASELRPSGARHRCEASFELDRSDD